MIEEEKIRVFASLNLDKDGHIKNHRPQQPEVELTPETLLNGTWKAPPRRTTWLPDHNGTTWICTGHPRTQQHL